MIKIKLFCSAGMSTSMLVTKMQDAAKELGLEAEINAYPEATIDKETDDCDVALLGPQVRFLLNNAKEICEPKGVAVDVIAMQDYGMMNGKKVLENALAMKK
jgi:PTS system cellobiose-specific IIB component